MTEAAVGSPLRSNGMRTQECRAIRRIAIIGAGSGGPISGAELALLSMRAGFETVLEDVLPSHLRRAALVIEAADPAFGPRYATSIEEAVRDADLVIDTVPDELESKLEILSLLDRMAPPHTIFATPTETLSIADLASCTYRPGQCFGLRFLSFQPLHTALTHPPATSPENLACVAGFLSTLGASIAILPDLERLP